MKAARPMPHPQQAAIPAPGGGALQVTSAARWSDRVARGGFFLAGLSVFAVLGFILWVLFSNTLAFFQSVSPWEFLTGTEWQSVSTVERAEGEATGKYGILPLMSGTLLITLGAGVIGVPIGLGTAIYLSEYASARIRGILKPVLEILAGIPSIVFGFFALQVVSPAVQWLSEPGRILYIIFGKEAGVFSAMNAIIVVGVMVLPIVTTLSEDALRAVPRHLREASYGLGATKWETTRKVVVPAALSGITASFVLGIARAIGETMAVALAAGTQPTLTLNPLDAVQTMTAFIVQRASGDLPQDGPDYLALFAVGAALFVMTLALNVLAQRFVRRYRQVGEGQ